jgi:hypothetical protein
MLQEPLPSPPPPFISLKPIVIFFDSSLRLVLNAYYDRSSNLFTQSQVYVIATGKAINCAINLLLAVISSGVKDIIKNVRKRNACRHFYKEIE